MLASTAPAGTGAVRTMLARPVIVRAFDWSSDAGRIAYVAGVSATRDALEVVTLSSGRERLVRATRPSRRGVDEAFFQVAWRPRTDWLAVGRGSPADATIPAEIVLVDARGGGVRGKPLARDADHDSRFAWSPDGTRLVYRLVRSSESARFGTLVLLDVRSRIVHRFAPSLAGTDPSWSPDGRRVAVATSEGIAIVDADGRGAHAVTHGGARDRWPTWSPDGAFIAYTHQSGSCNRPRGGCRQALYVVAPDDPRPLPLPRAPRVATHPAWSPR